MNFYKIILNVLKLSKRQLFYWANRRRCKNLPKDIKINGRSIFTKSTVVGSNCHFNGLQIRGKGDVLIGSNFHSGDGCLFITDVHNYEGKMLPYDETYISKNIRIGENVWLGSNVTILGGVQIGDGAIIQAGSVVVSDIGFCDIAGGHPAVVFSSRNIESYNDRVENNRYF
jgi:acetyltransferase-like isoleucine patch superfamily enzyme